MSDLETRIGQWFDQLAEMTPENLEARRDVELVITKLDDGQLRVAEIADDGSIIVHEWVRSRPMLLLFRLRGLGARRGRDPSSTATSLELKHDFERRGVRAVPGAIARRGSYLAPGVILMPSFVNIGAWVGQNTMVDTWATVGSCAQIGANVHLAGGVGIGGVLEPTNAVPVVIEDDAFIGSRCMIVEGARVGRGAVLGAGTILNPSIPVIDAETGEEVSRGYVPDYCVAVSAVAAARVSRRRVLPAVRADHQAPERGRAPRQGALNDSAARSRRRDVSRLDETLTWWPSAR